MQRSSCFGAFRVSAPAPVGTFLLLLSGFSAVSSPQLKQAHSVDGGRGGALNCPVPGPVLLLSNPALFSASGFPQKHTDAQRALPPHTEPERAWMGSSFCFIPFPVGLRWGG